MFNIKKQIGENLTSLVVVSDLDSIVDVIGSAAKNYNKICYVSFSRPYHSFLKYFEQNNIPPDNFFFIDCITKSSIKPKKTENAVFISSANNFPEIQKTIRKTLSEKKFDILVFDSLSSTLVYEKEAFLIRFLHTLAGMIKAFQIKSAFLVLEKDINFNLIKSLGMQTDKTIFLI